MSNLNFAFDIKLGHKVRKLSKPIGELTHEWDLYVKAADEAIELHRVVERVVFGLHPTFADPTRTCWGPQFSVKENGFGGFEVNIVVTLRNKEFKDNPRSKGHEESFVYMLDFPPYGEKKLENSTVETIRLYNAPNELALALIDAGIKPLNGNNKTLEKLKEFYGNFSPGPSSSKGKSKDRERSKDEEGGKKSKSQKKDKEKQAAENHAITSGVTSARMASPPSGSEYRESRQETSFESNILTQDVRDGNQDLNQVDEMHTGLTQEFHRLTIEHPSETNTRDFMMEAFGGCLNKSEQLPETVWGKRWIESVNLHGKLYLVPGGNVGRKYVDLLTKEVSRVIQNECSERLLVFSRLVLQRDPMVNKTRDVKVLIGRRLQSWEDGNFSLLLQEAKRCASRPLRNDSGKYRTRDEHTSYVFAKMMMEGKVRSAMRWLTSRSGGGVLDPNDDIPDSKTKRKKRVLDVLKEKHPAAQCSKDEARIHMDSLPELETVTITSAYIEKFARSMYGGAGPSGTDSEHWKDVFLRFGAHSSSLRDEVAALTTKIANEIVPWSQIRALMSGRLIALDKCPGVRPIGIGECLRRIMCKCVADATKKDLEEVCGAQQLACGLKSGIEGAVHAIEEIFDCNKEDGHGLLLMDASNAFNSLNRETALWNVRVLWPRCSRFLFNTYRGYAPLIIAGTTEVLYSREGTTQGDPLAMLFYGVSLMPLIRLLESPDKYRQAWYADDSSALGKLEKLLDWLLLLMENGPKYGYYPEPSKSYLVVHPNFIDEAHRLFDQFGIKIVEGRRYLGGYVGSEEGKSIFTGKKVQEWLGCLDELSKVARDEPQAALVGLTRSLQCEWNFVHRVVKDVSELFTPLEKMLEEIFLPNLLGVSSITHTDRVLFSLPAKRGGLGVRNPVESADLAFSTSREATSCLVDSILNQEDFDQYEHKSKLKEARRLHEDQQDELDRNKLDEVLAVLPADEKRAVMRSIHNNCSLWLTSLPLSKDNFDLSKVEFRDALSIRYKKPLLKTFSKCDGCQQDFDLQHALSCKKGGLVTLRHNEIRDAIGDLASLLWKDVRREPIIKEANVENGTPALVADLMARGVWDRQSAASFDIRVTDTDAPSYLNRSPMSVLIAAEEEKKRKYVTACEDRHTSFTPLVTSVDGVLAPEFTFFLKRIADGLSAKWDRPYNQIMCWVRCRVSFAILRATNVCIRGTRTKWRSLGLEDGSTIGMAI